MARKLAALFAGLSALGIAFGSYLTFKSSEMRPEVATYSQAAEPVHEQLPCAQTEQPKKQTLEEAVEKTEPKHLPDLPPREHSIEAETRALEKIAAAGGLTVEQLENGQNTRIKKENGCVVEMHFQLYPINELDVSDFPELKKLFAAGCRIEKIKGLGYCTEMESLAVFDNSLRELPELRYLKKLQKAHLNANQLREIDVTGLENLRVLILAINQLENIHGLETLIHLERIYCHDNPLDIGAVYRALSNAKYLNTAIITSPEYKERDLQIIKGNLQRSEVF